MLTLVVLVALVAGAAILGGKKLLGWLMTEEKVVVDEAKKVEAEVKSKL
jgi:hypothetical protein